MKYFSTLETRLLGPTSNSPPGLSILESSKIFELSKIDNPGGELELGPKSRVSNVEKYFKETFGITVQISNSDDSKLADNSMTLNQAGKA